MLVRTVFSMLERRGVDRYTLATWEARYLSSHHQAILETTVIAVVLLLVLLFAGGAFAQEVTPAAGKCAAMHAPAAEVAALRKSLTDARASNNVETLVKAVDAALRHLDATTAKPGCGTMMEAHREKPPGTPAPQAPPEHKH